MSASDFFSSTAGDLSGGPGADLGVTGFSFPTTANFIPPPGIAQNAWQPILPNLNLWNEYLHNGVNSIIANPSPTADDYNSVIGAIHKMEYDLLAYIDKVLKGTANQAAKEVVSNTSGDLVARLQHDLNNLNKQLSAQPQAQQAPQQQPAAPASSSWGWLVLLLLLGLLFSLSGQSKQS